MLFYYKFLIRIRYFYCKCDGEFVKIVLCDEVKVVYIYFLIKWYLNGKLFCVNV